MRASPRLVSWNRARLAAFVVALAFAPRPALAADAFVEGPRCRVSLVKLSYDDPGADDAEFIELRVERTEPPDVEPCDAGDAGDAGAGPLTLGDCGLDAIELIDGASAGCETYRTLPLADFAVPEDDVVAVCAQDAAVIGPFCDVTSAGRSALKAGWLQNGPNDGVRLKALAGTSAEFGYEAGPSCFGAGQAVLATETGEAPPSGSGIDDVNTLCGSGFVLLPATDAPLGVAPHCPVSTVPPGVHRDGGAPGTPGTGGTSGASGAHRDADASVPPPASTVSWTPEHAPAPLDPPVGDDSVWRPDASAVSTPSARPPAVPPACSLSGPGRGSSSGSAALCVVAACLAVRRRRRRSCSRRTAPRAGSCVRSGSWPSRSP